VLALLLAAACADPGNVLLVIADDVGVDRVAAYGEHPSPPPTPTLDGLAERGVLFRTCWANPLCSPTRATLMTGRYCHRTKVGWWVGELSLGLSLAEQTLAEVIAQGTGGAYRSALVGKWHLAGIAQSDLHPNQQGFETYSGALRNLEETPESYYDFDKVVDGASVHVDRYATTDTVDDALRLVEAFDDDPFLLVVAFHAAHVPYHRPPPHLHGQTLGGDPAATPIPHHEAAVEAMDRELGRLLDGIPAEVMARTTVIFVGDNGTQNPATEAPWPQGHGKGTLYEGGVRVPLIVAGPGVVPDSECRALVNTVDLMPTVAALAGVDATSVVSSPLDGISLLPYLSQPVQPSVREAVYAEMFRPNGHGPYEVHRRAVRGPRYKLIRNELSSEERLYDLALDPFEQQDLLLNALSDEERAALLALRAHLEAP